MTLNEKYYAINKALNKFLQSKSIVCPVIKYGVDPATVKLTFKDQKYEKFPYIQTSISNVKQQAWTSKAGGILTEFDFQMNFFTSPEDERDNDAGGFIPFDVAKIAFTDVNTLVLGEVDALTGIANMIASVLETQFHYEFEMKSGSPVPSAFMLARMRTVCSYPKEAGIPDATLSTDIYSGITLNGDDL